MIHRPNTQLRRATALAHLVMATSVYGVSPDGEYRATVTERAARVVDQIGVTDSARRDRVVEIIADQYVRLNQIHAGQAVVTDVAKGPAYDRVVAAHRKFVALLAANLTPEQVEAVKDGMTYGVATTTYNAYVRLLPEMTDQQKRMVRAHLLEAREYAMDGGSAEEKHAWFGKYKGRINNRLSEVGYDLKQAERDLAARDE